MFKNKEYDQNETINKLKKELENLTVNNKNVINLLNQKSSEYEKLKDKSTVA